ncbi:hypothetical protein FOA52_015400 [Chlamydomonas sp. UWO 241]|nr:hypothetical protein FOA52_015400 [Chlamydomonas sp. UWO 241]
MLKASKRSRPLGGTSLFSALAQCAVILFCLAAIGGLAYLSRRVKHVPKTGHATLDVCRAALHTEHSEIFVGSVVAAGTPIDGKPGLETADAYGCCSECRDSKDCNIWVWCADPASCGTQCWLKRVNEADSLSVPEPQPSVPWTSGSLAKAYRHSLESLPPVDESIVTVALSTDAGQIRITLQPEWSLDSVAYVRRLAQNPILCSGKCEFYRAESGFLLQGSLESFIPPNTVTKPGPKIMERGDIGWAGGGAGPDFFIYLGAQPATHFGTDHTVWGVIADESSLQVVERLVALPIEQPWLSSNNPMKMLVHRAEFEISKA